MSALARRNGLFLGDGPDTSDGDANEDDHGDHSNDEDSETDPSDSDSDTEGVDIPLPGFDIRVEVNGERLQEYDYPYDRPGEGETQRCKDEKHRKLVKYLLCEPDTYPIIAYNYDEDFGYATPKEGPTIRIEFWVDGQNILTHCDNFTSKRVKNWDDCWSEFLGKTHGVENTFKNFSRRHPVSIDRTKFNTIDLEELLQLKTMCKREFEVRIWPCSTTVARGKTANRGSVLDTDKPVSEKAAKGLALTLTAEFEQAPFQANERGVRIPRVQVTYNQGYREDSPLAIYVWKYRDLESLKQLGVIERTPLPTPEPKPQPVVKRLQDMTHQELLEHALKQQQTQLQIKREDLGNQFRTNADGDDDDVEFVSLRPSKRVRRAPTEADVVVDLID